MQDGDELVFDQLSSAGVLVGPAPGSFPGKQTPGAQILGATEVRYLGPLRTERKLLSVEDETTRIEEEAFVITAGKSAPPNVKQLRAGGGPIADEIEKAAGADAEIVVITGANYRVSRDIGEPGDEKALNRTYAYIYDAPRTPCPPDSQQPANVRYLPPHHGPS